MKRLITVCLVIILSAFFMVCAVNAQNPPVPYGHAKTSRGAAVAQQHPDRFYGYVPPPPIRHTWPGGYRVIIHEMTNTLIQHILGHY